MRSYALKLVFYLTLSDLVQCASVFIISPLMFYNRDEALISDVACKVQAYAITFAYLGSLAWSCIISYALIKTIVFGCSDIDQYNNRFLSLGFGVPALATLM